MTVDSARTARSDAPGPERVRLFGTSWVDRGAGYWVRRALVALGALLASVAGVLVIRQAVSGVAISGAGTLVDILLITAVTLCSGMAGLRNWKMLTHGRSTLTGWMADDRSLNPIVIVGFVGSLVAYFVRSLVEAPGEGLARARHEADLAEYERRRAARSGRPNRRKAAKRKGVH